jgi:hypothetical protein
MDEEKTSCLVKIFTDIVQEVNFFEFNPRNGRSFFSNQSKA